MALYLTPEEIDFCDWYELIRFACPTGSSSYRPIIEKLVKIAPVRKITAFGKCILLYAGITDEKHIDWIIKDYDKRIDISINPYSETVIVGNVPYSVRSFAYGRNKSGTVFRWIYFGGVVRWYYRHENSSSLPEFMWKCKCCCRTRIHPNSSCASFSWQKAKRELEVNIADSRK